MFAFRFKSFSPSSIFKWARPIVGWLRDCPKSARIAIAVAFATGLMAQPMMSLLKRPAKAASDDSNETKPIPVTTQEVHRQTIFHQFTTHSFLLPKKEVLLRPNANVTVRQLLVEVGQKVKRGQPLAYTDSQAQQLRSELDEIDLKQKNLDYSVTLTLAKKSFISAKEYEEKKLDHRASQIRKRLAEIETTGAILSPINGVVSEIALKSGDYIDNPSQYYLKIADTSGFRIQLYLPQAVAAKLKKGMWSVLTRSQTDEYGKESTEFASGLVEAIAPVVDPKSGSVLTDISVTSVPSTWIAGQYVQLSLTVDQANQILAVPNEAIVFENNRAFVYRVPGPNEEKSGGTRAPSSTGDDSVRVIKEEITLGLRDARVTEIKTGLEENDEVVVEGQGNLADNAAINVVH